MDISRGLNVFQLLIFAGAINGFILSGLLFFKQKRGANIYLGLFVLGFAFGSIKIVLQEKIPDFNYYLPLPLLYQFALGPLLYFYIRRSFIADIIQAKNQFLHFIPSILFDIVPAVILFYIGPHHYKQEVEKMHFLIDMVGFMFFAYYMLLSVRLFSKKRLQSSENKKASKWLIKILVMASLICVSWLFYIIMVLVLNGEWIYGILPYYPIYILIGVCIYSIGIAGYYQPEIGLLKIPVNEKRELLSETDVKVKQQYIINAMMKELYYYDENITLKKLSQKLDIPSKELSYIINTGFQKNFNDFINELRITDFKSRLEDPRNAKYNLLGLAYEVGFNSKASFYRAFKKATSQTPGEFFKDRNMEK